MALENFHVSMIGNGFCHELCPASHRVEALMRMHGHEAINHGWGFHLGFAVGSAFMAATAILIMMRVADSLGPVFG